jgi:glyoxylase-like metal-dependent hydrolase (beta-lactamase superfamily II)
MTAVYELIRAGEDTYYIDCPVKIGVFHIGGGRVCLIDAGNGRDTAKKILKILDERHWTLDSILSTHFHADHVGGNHLLQERTGCAVYAAGADRAFLEFGDLEAALLFGAAPPKSLRKNKAFAAQASVAQALTEDVLPPGLHLLRLDGHSIAMSALATRDGVWFLADSVVSAETLEKYHISFLYDLEAYLASLEMLESLEGSLFVPAHAPACTDIRPLVERNRRKAWELLDLVRGFCAPPGLTQEDLLRRVFDHYRLTLDFSQWLLCGATLRAYLSYLLDRGEVTTETTENRLLWRLTK